MRAGEGEAERVTEKLRNRNAKTDRQTLRTDRDRKSGKMKRISRGTKTGRGTKTIKFTKSEEKDRKTDT